MDEASIKVPGGKLVRLRCRLEDGHLRGVQLSGDFFLMPPEKISVLEEAMEGFPVSDTDELEDLLAYVIERDSVIIEGFSPADLVGLVRELS